MSGERRMQRASGWRRLALRLGLGLLGLLALAALVVGLGIVPVPASSGHWAITNWVLHFAMRRSVATHSLGIQAPELNRKGLIVVGAGHYEEGCRFCHGAPGARMPRVLQASTPAPPPLNLHVADYSDAELFYIVRHGIKFTGMPAWPAPQRDDEVWAVVAFLRALPRLDGDGYSALVVGPDSLYQAEAPPVVRARCARCHGTDGKGRDDAVFPHLAGQKLQYLAEALGAYARGSRHSGIMGPLAASLPKQELQAAARWYATRPGMDEGPTPAAPPQVLVENDRIPLCESCHSDGDKSHAAFPRLWGQHPEYLTQQLTLLAEGRRGGGPYLELMQTVVHWLEPAERRALAAHFGATKTRDSP